MGAQLWSFRDMAKTDPSGMLKMARQFWYQSGAPQKQKIIGRYGEGVGGTLACRAVGGMPAKEKRKTARAKANAGFRWESPARSFSSRPESPGPDRTESTEKAPRVMAA